MMDRTDPVSRGHRALVAAACGACLLVACRSGRESGAPPPSASAVAASAVESAGRPRDPWVFRSVLDGNPRMLTLALHDDLWLAVDVQRGRLWRAWKGDVHFTGTVYDTLHGPQPLSRGSAYFGGDSGVEKAERAKSEDRPAAPAAAPAAAGWRLATGEPARLTWLGHRFGEPDASGKRPAELLWRLDGEDRAPIEIALVPDVRRDPAGLVLRLDFRTEGLGDGEALLLDLPPVGTPLVGMRRSSERVTLTRGKPSAPETLSVSGDARIEFLLPALPDAPPVDAPDEDDPFVDPTLAATERA